MKSKYFDTMVDILDGQFPKKKCKERGCALVMLVYIEMMLNGTKFNEEGLPLEEEVKESLAKEETECYTKGYEECKRKALSYVRAMEEEL